MRRGKFNTRPKSYRPEELAKFIKSYEWIEYLRDYYGAPRKEECEASHKSFSIEDLRPYGTFSKWICSVCQSIDLHARRRFDLIVREAGV